MGFLGKGKATIRPQSAPTSGGSTRDRGNLMEDQALGYLQKMGMALVQRNYRTPGRGGGEIDLILRERDATLVFVEVRSRRSAAFGGAGGSIDAAKRQRIVLAARHYLARWAAPPACRFDVVLLEGGQIEWLRGAFDAE